ncbi:MAG: hemolysin family protein [Bacilli bacterium]
MFGDLELPPSVFILNNLTNSANPWTYVFLLFLLLFSAFFAGCETAYADCNRHKLKAYASDGKKGAKMAIKILNLFDTTIITALIIENVTRISMSVIATVILVNLTNEALGSVLSTIIITLLVFFVGDAIPKNIAKANPDKWAVVCSYFVWFFVIILYPVSIIFRELIKFVKLFIRNKKEETEFTEDDFQDAVEDIEEKGAINEEESDIIKNAVDFGDILVKDIATKKEDIVGLDIKNCNKDYITNFFTKSKYSRLPVYNGDIDHIVGVIHVRVFLKALFTQKSVNVMSLLTQPYYVSPQLSLDEIFDGFKEHHTHLAFIRDKNGKTLAMVTMEDVLEELVEDIEETNDANVEVIS